MINTSFRKTKHWYYDAVVAYITLQGYSRQEARRMVNRHGLKTLLRRYAVCTMHCPPSATAEMILEFYQREENSNECK